MALGMPETRERRRQIQEVLTSQQYLRTNWIWDMRKMMGFVMGT